MNGGRAGQCRWTFDTAFVFIRVHLWFRLYAFRLTPYALRYPSGIGSDRTRLPVAANTALITEGATLSAPGSPWPPQKPPVGTKIVSTFGISASRGSGKSWKLDSTTRPSLMV